MNKIKVKDISLLFTESSRFKCPKSFSSMDSVNSFLRHESFIADNNKEDGKQLGYFKTDFVLTFEDGQTYSGRYDIGSDSPDLSSHIRDFALTYSGQRKPSHFTDEQWEQFKKVYCSPKSAEGYKELLEKYEF